MRNCVFGARLRHGLVLHQFNGDRELHRRLERIAGELAIPLRRVTIAEEEQSAGMHDG
jgi:hypothetical protein